MPFLPVLQSFHFETLGDVERFISENADDAYLLALSALAVTDIDIIAESIGLQNLCFVHVLKNGGGRKDIIDIYDMLNGKRESNRQFADILMEQASSLPFMQSSHPATP